MHILSVSAVSQSVKTQISTSLKKVLSAQRHAISVSAQVLLAKVSVKQVLAQVGSPVRFCERTEVAAAVRKARMVGNCIVAEGC
jgi:hypothetical protein